MKTLKALQTKQLLAIYNGLAAEPVKKFRDRKTYEARTAKIILEQKKGVASAVIREVAGREANGIINEAFPVKKRDPNRIREHKVTKKGRKVLRALFSLDNMTIDGLIPRLGGNAESIEHIFERLIHSRLVEKVEIGRDSNDSVKTFYNLTETGKDYVDNNAIGIDAEPDQDFSVGDYVVSGPIPEYTGKRIYHSQGFNPRKPGTSGHASYELITDGMTYEDYRKLGGIARDLKWDIDKGWATVK